MSRHYVVVLTKAQRQALLVLTEPVALSPEDYAKTTAKHGVAAYDRLVAAEPWAPVARGLRVAHEEDRDSTITPVLFRVWKGKEGGVLALFPHDDEGNGKVSSFMHVGQHGGADLVGCLARTRPATPEEYADLKRELEKTPYYYKLKVYRSTPKRRK